MTQFDGASVKKTTIRTLIVEDYTLVRVGIVALIKADPLIEMVGEAESAEEGLKLIEQQRPNVVLMDLGLPNMNGIEATHAVKKIDPNIKVIILTSHEDKEAVVAALSAGANAYCLKDIPSARLLEVIKSVAEGAAWLDPAVASVALDLFNQADFRDSFASQAIKQPESTLAAPLAGREVQVLELLVQGKNNSEIAQELFVSIHTVKAHVSNILQKMSVTDRVQAAVKAVQEGLVQFQ